MRLLLRFFGIFALFVIVVDPAEAMIQQYDPISGYDCAGDMTTTNCFSPPTGTSFSGPATTACYAKGRDHQRCRNCEPDYYPNGQPTGYNVCKYVPQHAACECEYMDGKKCRGNTPSVCQYSW